MALCCGGDEEVGHAGFEAVGRFYQPKPPEEEEHWQLTRVVIDSKSPVIKLMPPPPQRATELPFGPQFAVAHKVCRQEGEDPVATPYRVVLWAEGCQTLLFCVGSESEASEWVTRIRAVLATMNRPKWQPNSDSDRCSSTRCARKFGFLRRRHHCRACGLLFCGKCSSQFERLGALGYSDPVRICDGCVEQRSTTSGEETNPYLEWIREKCEEAKVATKREEQLFSTVQGDWLTNSCASLASSSFTQSHPCLRTSLSTNHSVDSVIAQVCIDSLQQGPRPSNLTTTTIDTWGDFDESQVSDVQQASEHLIRQAQLNMNKPLFEPRNETTVSHHPDESKVQIQRVSEQIILQAQFNTNNPKYPMREPHDERAANHGSLPQVHVIG